MSEAPAVPTPTFTIRVADVDDVPAIDWLDTFGSSPTRDIHRMVSQYFGSVDPTVHEHNIIYLAEMAGPEPTDLPFRAVGKAELLLAPSAVQSDVGYIKRIVVHPLWRSRGIARALLDYVRAEASERGLRSLDLHVWDGNRSAIALYESMGFHERHREVYMRLSLDAPADRSAPAKGSPPHDPA